MQRQILLFSIGKEKKTAIQKICAQMRCSAIEIDKRHYDESLGSLLGICEATQPAKDSKLGGLYTAMGFPVEMMIFCGFSRDDLDLFLKSYKETGLESVPLKAMITPHNINWSAARLFGELMEEHKRFGAGK